MFPYMRRPRRRFVLLGLLSGLLLGLLPTADAQSGSVSYWGMNLYLTKRERRAPPGGGPADNLTVLAQSASTAGVRWTREEFTWVHVEPENDGWNPVYDGTIRLASERGFQIIGMLLTTPAWARDPTCRNPGPAYWCPPRDVNEFAEYAGWMAERYDGDGQADAPGSPRVAAWQIWNEPNDEMLWPNIGADSNVRKARYGQLLVAARNAIKRANSSALVLTGGVYMYDGSCAGGLCDGFNFFNAPGGVFKQVPAARTAFDVLAIHPYISTTRPEAPESPPAISLEGRIVNTREWLDHGRHDINRPDAPIWITEIGWCTEASSACGAQVSLEQQANYLVRAMVIAQQRGVQHTSWFQFDDAFNRPGEAFNSMAIVRDYDGSSYQPKPAYHAYRTLAGWLQRAKVAGTGPLHTHVLDLAAHRGNSSDLYDYRYADGTTTIDVVWRTSGSVDRSFPVVAGRRVQRVDRDGTVQDLQPVGGVINLRVSEEPVLIVQSDLVRPAKLLLTPSSLSFLARPGGGARGTTLWIGNGGDEQLTWSASESIAWLTLSKTSGSGPDNILVTATPGSLRAGTYTGTIFVRSNGGDLQVPVQLKLTDRMFRVFVPLVR